MRVRILSLSTLLLLLFLSSSPMLSQANAQNSEKVLFFDDFESYAVGSFPSNGGWEIVYNGRGDKYQVVTGKYAFSGSKSLHLWGETGWSCVVQKKFSTSASLIGYEFAIFFESKASDHQDHPGFYKKGAEDYWGTHYATVLFDHKDGKIKAEDGTILGNWVPRTWYRVRVILDRQSKTYSVWINGELKGKDMKINAKHPELIDAIALTSAWPGQEVYYDDVRVFEITGSQNYYLRVDFLSSVVNGKSLSGANPEIKVRPGEILKGYLEVVVDNNRGGSWITPVIGTCSWGREMTGQAKGWFATLTSDAPTGKSRQRLDFELKAPTKPGTYYIGIFAGWMYSGDEVASSDHPPKYGNGNDVWDMQSSNWEEVMAKGVASSGPYRMPGRAIRIVVEPEYYLRVRLDSATLNGQSLSAINPELRVKPGDLIRGSVTFTVEQSQPGSWICPVIWVTSWERGSVADGKVRVVADDIRSTRQFTVNIDVKAPTEPGTYYIGFFAGHMYNPDEVASNDHPPRYGDGDDVWDMRGSDWESVIANGQAPEGAVYRMPGRAIRIVVAGPPPMPDLVIEKVEPGTPPVEGGTVELLVTIKNVGNAAANPGWYVDYYIDGRLEHRDGPARISLGVGASVVSSFKWTIPNGFAGEHVLKVVVDPTNVVIESSEMNNEREVRIIVKPSLTISIFANPTSGTAPLTVHFTASASGGTPPYTYRWDFGDGASAAEQNPSHTYVRPGTYTAVCRVTDAAGASASSSITINVGEGAGATVDFTVSGTNLIINIKSPRGVGSAQVKLIIPTEINVGEATLDGFMKGALHLYSGSEHRWFQLKAGGQATGSLIIPLTLPPGRSFTVSLVGVDLLDTEGNTIPIKTSLPIERTVSTPTPSYGVDLECPDNHHSISDSIAGTAYRIKVTNTGSARDTITLRAFPEVGIEGSVMGRVEPSSVTLDPGESAWVILFVKGDAFTRPGDYRVTVTGTSAGDPAKSDTVETITTITPSAKGDINQDGKIDARDLVLMKRIVLGLSDPKPAADMNGDGKVDATDLVLLKRELLRGGGA